MSPGNRSGGGRDGMGSGGGQGRGMGRGGRGMGLSGECVCPKCGAAVPHQRGVQCIEMQCPKCGAKMTR